MNVREQYELEMGVEAYAYTYNPTPEYIKWLEDNLELTENLLKSRQRVLDEIPECPQHGKCVPHALEWIQEKKNG